MNSNNCYVFYKFKIKWQYSAVWDKFVLWNSSFIISLLMFIWARNVCDMGHLSNTVMFFGLYLHLALAQAEF